MEQQKLVKKKGRLEAVINFDNIKLTIESEEPVQSLREINKIIHAMKAIEFNRDYSEGVEDEPLLWRLGYMSEELRANAEIVAFAKDALKIEENLKHRKIAIENTKIIDLGSKNFTSSVDVQKSSTKLVHLCDGFGDSRFAILHIIGSIPDDEKKALVDVVRSRLQNAELRTMFTNKEMMGKTVVEAVFFGSFEDSDLSV